jgi:hypothetical protein
MRLPRIERSKLGRRINRIVRKRSCHLHRMVLNHISIGAHQCVFYTCGSHALPLPRNVHLVVVRHALRRRARDLYPFCYLLQNRNIVPNTRRSCALPPATISCHSVLTNIPDLLASPSTLQRCGAAASRAAGGGMASPVSVLTRGSVRGAPFLTNSVLISTF